MSDTTHLQLPLLAAAQAQKHVTHNDALLRLDALVHLSVKDRDLTAPPSAPADGERYIPASGATGAWAGWDVNIAWYSDGVWTKLTPREGWRVWVDDEDVALVWDGAEWLQVENGGGAGGRELLTAARTYFVDGSTGSDANEGLTSGTAFATIQKAIDAVAALDLGLFNVTVQVAAGTYTATNVLKTLAGAGKVFIVGDEATPANVHINAAAGDCFTGIRIRGTYQLKGLKLSGATAIFLNGAGIDLEFQAIDFGACTGQHIYLESGAQATATGNYSISGGASRHWLIARTSKLFVRNVTVTLTGTPGLPSGFCVAGFLGVVRADSNTFSGGATGKRYDVSTNAAVDVNGAGATYFPGDGAGSVATGGQYV